MRPQRPNSVQNKRQGIHKGRELNRKNRKMGKRRLQHRWELPVNYPVFTMIMVIYHYIEGIWIILVTSNFLYNIYNRELILSR